MIHVEHLIKGQITLTHVRFLIDIFLINVIDSCFKELNTQSYDNVNEEKDNLTYNRASHLPIPPSFLFPKSFHSPSARQ